MSVRKKANGKYEVRYGQGHGKPKPGAVFERRGDADAADLDFKRRKQLGPLAASVIDAKMTLTEFVETDYWPRYAMVELAAETRERNLQVWEFHIEPRLGYYAVRDIRPETVEDFLAQLKKSRVGVPTRLKAVFLLSGILRRAVVRQLIPINPVKDASKPEQPPTQLADPISPAVVEKIRTYMLERAWASEKRGTGRSPEELHRWRLRNALMISMMAYGGLRPVEDRGAAWGNIREHTLHVHSTKTRQDRDVDLVGPLFQELAEWRLICGRPGDKELIVPRPTGGEWTKADYSNWRARVWKPAAIAAGVTGKVEPRRLRASYVSLMLWETQDIAAVAQQSGHSVAVLAKHYAGTIREFRNQPRRPAEEVIREARANERDVLGTRRERKL